MINSAKKPQIICLMGPTASGKTALAVELVQRFPCEIISVDSAMVYRGMDIGTAKPGAEILRIAPHRLIDFLDPAESYSAGQFRIDAMREIKDIHAHGKIPLLVGGTMMYFKILQQGLAPLPKADAKIRAELKSRAENQGWEGLHAYLMQVDKIAGERINAKDSQRIQRALEVYMLTGKTITEWQKNNTNPLAEYNVYNFALAPLDRAQLHERIALRFDHMLQAGLIDEVRHLYERGDLNEELPSIRSVGYREVWNYLEGKYTYEEMREKAIAATRQLAKRQMTWLRSWPDIEWLDAEDGDVLEKMSRRLG
jgi:tRNA dimethylallyltransferase